MAIEFDPAKREETLRERSLDFRDAVLVFEGHSDSKDAVDDRIDYGEVRIVTFGWLRDRAVAIVWTERAGRRRIVSMRHMHDEEVDDVGLDRP